MADKTATHSSSAASYQKCGNEVHKKAEQPCSSSKSWKDEQGTSWPAGDENTESGPSSIPAAKVVKNDFGECRNKDEADAARKRDEHAAINPRVMTTNSDDTRGHALAGAHKQSDPLQLPAGINRNQSKKREGHVPDRKSSPAPSFASSVTVCNRSSPENIQGCNRLHLGPAIGIDGIPSFAKADADDMQVILQNIGNKTNNTKLKLTAEPHRDDSPHGAAEAYVSSQDIGEAYTASKIFAPDALPLHLPRLDHYIATHLSFQPPRFSNPRTLCCEQEIDLYRYDEGHKATHNRMEVAGSQLAIPSSPSKLRRRKQSRSGRSRDSRDAGDRHELHSLAYGWNRARKDGGVDAQRTADSHLEKLQSKTPQSEGIASRASTCEDPLTRLAMFPPLMLLRENSLDELKSNAVGPRKAPGGFIGKLPGLGHVLGTVIDFLIGVEGSTFAAGIFRLQLLIDFVQMMDLNLHFVNATHISTSAKRLKTISAIISVNYVSVFGFAIVILFSMMGIVAMLLFFFWQLTRMYNPNRTLEGYASQPWLFRLIPRSKAQGQAGVPQLRTSTAWSKAGHVVLIMTLTILYIPLSKLASDALVWNVDYWPDAKAPNTVGSSPIISTTKYCYRTNLDNSTFNWAYVIIPSAVLVLLGYTLWYPWQMRKMIKEYLPRVAANNELGQKRSRPMMDMEYVRELDRDRAPFNFMYNAYRRRFGDYKPLYLLFFKLSTLLVVSIVTQQNCLFQHFAKEKMLVAQQAALIGLQATLLGAHLQMQPFVDMVSNRSELVSRVGYTVTSVLGLITALTGDRRTVLETVFLYAVEGISYGFNIYLSVVGTAWMNHLIKRAQRRIDFSIDIFSPFLKLEKHVKRRIWQETISTILLCGEEYRMPVGQSVMFSIDDGWPPYLVQFHHSAAERHIENLKILKHVGIQKYQLTTALLNRMDQDGAQLQAAIKRIQLEFTGPDSYWQPLEEGGESKACKALEGVTSFFGKSFFVPFPPTVVIRFDQTASGLRGESTVQLTTITQFHEYIRQNACDDVQSRRWVRQALRSLDNQPVVCPFVQTAKRERTRSLFSKLHLPSLRTGYQTLETPVFYENGILRIRRRVTSGLSEVPDRDAGFDVTIQYKHGQRQDPGGMTTVKDAITVEATAAFGLRFDFEYTDSVRHFIDTNSATIRIRMPQLQAQLQQMRDRLYREVRAKGEKLSYTFLTDVYDRPATSVAEVEERFASNSSCSNVRQLPRLYPAATRLLTERIDHVNQTPVHRWWYLFWDDLWRQNSNDFACLRRHRTTFNPMYPSSIAYTPLPRARLVALLHSKRGVWVRDTPRQHHKSLQCATGFRDRGLFDIGLVNRIYFSLDEIAFAQHSSCTRSKIIVPHGDSIRLGARDNDGHIVPQLLRDIEQAGHTSKYTHRSDADADADAGPGSQHTGGGTNENDTHIIERGAWEWTEQRLGGRRVHSTWRFIRTRVLEWLSIQPYKLDDRIAPLYIYLRLVDGHYETASPPPQP